MTKPFQLKLDRSAKTPLAPDAANALRMSIARNFSVVLRAIGARRFP